MAHVLHATRREYQKLGKAGPGADLAPVPTLSLSENGHA